MENRVMISPMLNDLAALVVIAGGVINTLIFLVWFFHNYRLRLPFERRRK